MNSGDTAFMLIATAMVMVMTPALALFYGGLVRRKNVLATTMQSFVCLGIISILWVVYGYSLAFGPDVGHFIGNLDHIFLKGVGLEPGPYAATIPSLLFCAFQLMFANYYPGADYRSHCRTDEIYRLSGLYGLVVNPGLSPCLSLGMGSGGMAL